MVDVQYKFISSMIHLSFLQVDILNRQLNIHYKLEDISSSLFLAFILRLILDIY